MPTIDYQPNEAAAADAFVRSDQPTTNLGTNTQLIWGVNGPTFRSLFYFDLFALGMPQNAVPTIGNCNLILNCSTGAAIASPAAFYRCTRAWVESQVTWNVWSTGNNWTTEGGDFDATVTSPHSLPTTTGEKTFDLYALVLDAIQNRNGILNILAKRITESGNSRPIFSSSSAATPSLWPRLIINYTLPDSGAVVRRILEAAT